MSDYETPASGSLFDQMASPDPGAYPQEWAAEEQLDEAAEGVRDAQDASDDFEGDWLAEYEDFAEQDPQGFAEALASPEMRQHVEELAARRAYEQHVDQVEAGREAEAKADSMVREAAERHNLPQSLEDGSLRAIADWVWNQAAEEAFNNGHEERYAQLHTPAGVRAAVDLAAQIALQERAREWAWKGNGPDLSTEKGRRDRAEWVAHAARRGIPGAPLWREETTP